ncbi:hypothetical protein A9R05_02585 [Burkholderia sp. KK1]|nr:hypothetical protein A9R05_02585 [Burkholderia sp. KK1]
MRQVMRVKVILSFIFICAAGLVTNGTALACRVSLDFSTSMPPNAVEIDNGARLRLADTIIRTRAWPDEAIASALTPAFSTEHKPEELAKRRAAAVKDILLQLGIKEQNIFIDAKVLSHPIAPSREARERLRDVYIEFTPQCYGHCAQLCDGSYTPPKK